MQRQHLIAGTDRRLSRDRIAASQARDPPLAVSAGEGGRVRGPEHVAGRPPPSPVVQDEGQLGGQEQVGTGEQVGHQVIGEVLTPGVRACVRGAHADVVDGGEILFAVGADLWEPVSWVRARGHLFMMPVVVGNAGLIEHHSVGTRNLYVLAPDGMVAAQQWLVRTWDTVLAAYAAEVSRHSQRPAPAPAPALAPAREPRSDP